MYRPTRRQFVSATVGGSAASLSGCTLGGVTGSTDQTPTLGGILSLTGSLQGFGRPMRDAMVLATDLASGSETDITVEPRVYDANSTVDGRVSVAQSLVDDGVETVCGPITTTTPVAEEVLIPEGVVTCTPSTTVPSLSQLDDDGLVFRTVPSDRVQGPVMARVVSERLQNATAAISFIDFEYGRTLSTEFTDAFETEFGGSVVGTSSHDPTATELTTHVESLLEDDPETLVLVSYPDTTIRILQEYYRTVDGDHDLVLSDGAASPRIASQVDGDLYQIVGTLPAVAGPGADVLRSQFSTAYGTTPGPYVAHAFDAAAALLLATAAADDGSGTEIAAAMQSISTGSGREVGPEDLDAGIAAARSGEEINYRGAATTVDFDDRGDLQRAKYLVWKIDPAAASPITGVDTIEG